MSDTILVGDMVVPLDGMDIAAARAVLAQRLGRLASLGRPQVAPGETLLLCEIGGERFGLPLAAVAQVVPAVSATRVPGAPSALIGLIQQRGAIYNLLDPSAALGVHLQNRTDGHHLLLKDATPHLALRVDHAIGLVTLPAETRPSDERLTEPVTTVEGEHIVRVAIAALIAALGIGPGQKKE